MPDQSRQLEDARRFFAPYPVREPQPSILQQGKAAAGRVGRAAWSFIRHMFNEHEFWLHTLAVKGGLSAGAAAVFLFTSYAVALPALVAGAALVTCGAVVGLSLYGIVRGSVNTWHGLKSIYNAARGRPPPPPKAKKKRKPSVLLARIGTSRLGRFCKARAAKIAAHPAAQKIAQSRSWKLTRKVATEDSILGSLAVGGAVISLAIGGTAIAAQLAVVPVLAVGSLLTFATVVSVTSAISGVTGLYFSIDGLRHRARRKKAEAAALRQARTIPFPAPQPATKPRIDENRLRDFFHGLGREIDLQDNRLSNNMQPKGINP